MMLLLDAAPIAEIGVFLGVAFFFVVAASAAFAFVMLKKTIKMAVRLLIVGLILLIAVCGGGALWMFLFSSPSPNRPVRPANSVNRPANSSR